MNHCFCNDQPSSPISVANQSEPNPIDQGKVGKEKPKDTPVPTDNSSKSDTNGKEEKKHDKTSSELGKYGTCNGSIEILQKCEDPKARMIACIRSFENGTSSWIIVLLQCGVAVGRMILYLQLVSVLVNGVCKSRFGKLLTEISN